MKTYKNLVSEISAFRQQFREVENRYPGVHMFMSVAGRYINRPEKLKDGKLVRLLKKLKLKSDISNFSQSDFSRISKFIALNGLDDVEKTRIFFQNAKSGISNDPIDEEDDEDDDGEME